MVNNTKTTFYLAPDGVTVHEGDDPPPPNGSTTLVAPGCKIQDDKARKHGIYDKLAAGDAPPVARSSSGEPLVTLPGGRAMAAGLVGDDVAGKAEVMEAAKKEDDEKEAAEKKRSHKAKPKAADADDEGDDDEDEKADAAGKPGVTIKPESKAVRATDADVQDKAVKGPAPRRR